MHPEDKVRELKRQRRVWEESNLFELRMNNIPGVEESQHQIDKIDKMIEIIERKGSDIIDH